MLILDFSNDKPVFFVNQGWARLARKRSNLQIVILTRRPIWYFSTTGYTELLDIFLCPSHWKLI